MKCPHCHQEISDTAQFCSHCGEKMILPQNHCPNCGHVINPNDRVCSACGFQLPVQRAIVIHEKSKAVAVLLGLFLGGLGVHNFYLGYSSKGFIQVCLFLGGFLTFGLTSLASVIWALVETVLILVGTIDRDGDDHLIR